MYLSRFSLLSYLCDWLERPRTLLVNKVLLFLLTKTRSGLWIEMSWCACHYREFSISITRTNSALSLHDSLVQFPTDHLSHTAVLIFVFRNFIIIIVSSNSNRVFTLVLTGGLSMKSGDIKFSQISRTLLSILAYPNGAVVLILPLISSFH